MKFIRQLTVLVLLLSFGSFSFASSFYAGAKLSSLNVDPVDERFSTLILSGGVRVNHWFSVETHIGSSKDQTVFGDEVNIDSLVGIYAKFNGRNDKSSISPYISTGYTRVTVDDSFLGSATESGFSFGLGLDFSVSEHTYIDVGYMSYLDKDDDKVSGFSLGLNYIF